MADAQEIVRIASTDVDGQKSVVEGLRSISGVGSSLSHILASSLKLNKTVKVVDLTEKEINTIEKAIEDPSNLGVPSWTLNRQLDPESGKNKHLTGPELEVVQKFDIRKMRKIKSYKGIRHASGLPVRGQRTKSSFRKGKTIGVSKKKS